MKSRYCYSPAVRKKIGWHVFGIQKFVWRLKHRPKPEPDIWMVTGFEQAVFPSK